MTSNKHIHAYKRINIAKKEGKEFLVYKCQQPDCSHYLTPELVVGKHSECPRCGDIFKIQIHHLDLVFPYCDHCKREISNDSGRAVHD